MSSGAAVPALGGLPLSLLGDAGVVRSNLFEVIAGRLEDLILSRELPPGSRLPTEKELAAHFGVSRTVIREALSRLSAQGLVRTRVGAGTFVAMPDGQHLQDALQRHARITSLDRDGLRSLYEARSAIEVATARLASQRATASERGRIAAHLKEMKESADDRTRFAAADLGFHLEIAAASHSPLLLTLLEPLVALMAEGIAESLNRRAAANDGMRGHDAILKAIQTQKPEQAARAMQEHLGLSETHLALALHLGTSDDSETLDESDNGGAGGGSAAGGPPVSGSTV